MIAGAMRRGLGRETLYSLYSRTRYVVAIACVVHLAGLLCGIAFGLCSAGNSEAGLWAADVSAWGFFTHNMGVGVPAYLGWATMGLSSLGALLFQAFLIGASIGVASHAMPFGRVILALVPHGVFEVSGLIIAGGSGLLAPSLLVRHFRGGRLFTARDVLDYSALVSVSVAFIGIGALVEAHITPALLGLLYSV